MRLRFQAGFICSACLSIAVARGQTNTNTNTNTEEPVKVLTVCDILLGGAEFNGKTVAVLGRFAASDEGQWLLEDECVRKVEVNGAARESSVWLVPRGSPSEATSRMPALDQDSLRIKLELAGKTTKLGKHPQYQCTVSVESIAKGKNPECGYAELPDRWAIAYGRVETMGDRRYGFGHLGGSPAQVFALGALVFIDENGRPDR